MLFGPFVLELTKYNIPNHNQSEETQRPRNKTLNKHYYNQYFTNNKLVNEISKHGHVNKAESEGKNKQRNYHHFIKSNQRSQMNIQVGNQHVISVKYSKY